MELESLIATQQHDLLETKLTLQTLEGDHSALKRFYNEQSQSLTQIQSVLDSDRLEFQKVSQQLEEKEKLIQKLVSEISDKDRLIQDNEHVHENALLKYNEQLKVLETHLSQQDNATQDMIQTKEEEKSAAEALVSSLKSQLNNKTQEIQVLKEQAESYQQSAKSIEKDTLNLAELEKLKQENKALHDEINGFRSLPPGVGLSNSSQQSTLPSLPTNYLPSRNSIDKSINPVSSHSSTAAQLDSNGNPLSPRDEKILAIEGQRDALREALRSQRERKDHEIKTLSERVRQLEHRLEKEKHAALSVQQKLLNIPPMSSKTDSLSLGLGSASNISINHLSNEKETVQNSETIGLQIPPRRKIIKRSASFYNL